MKLYNIKIYKETIFDLNDFIFYKVNKSVKCVNNNVIKCFLTGRQTDRQTYGQNNSKRNSVLKIQYCLLLIE